MLKNTAAALALVLAVGCASTPLTQDATSGAASIGGGIATNAKEAPEYILLSSPTAVRTYDFGTRVYDLHVRGTMTNRGFFPAGQIQGNGKFCADGKDWLSLSDMKVHKADSGAPVAPYVLGCANPNGTFSPASRDIVAQ
jgi:hypothetical protein